MWGCRETGWGAPPPALIGGSKPAPDSNRIMMAIRQSTVPIGNNRLAFLAGGRPDIPPSRGALKSAQACGLRKFPQLTRQTGFYTLNRLTSMLLLRGYGIMLGLLFFSVRHYVQCIKAVLKKFIAQHIQQVPYAFKSMFG